jgi:hypothetical protein
MGEDDAAEMAGAVERRMVMPAWSGARQNRSFAASWHTLDRYFDVHTTRVSSYGNDSRMGLLGLLGIAEDQRYSVTTYRPCPRLDPPQYEDGTARGLRNTRKASRVRTHPPIVCLDSGSAGRTISGYAP